MRRVLKEVTMTASALWVFTDHSCEPAMTFSGNNGFHLKNVI